MKKLQIGLLALRELGIRRVALYGIYRLGLITGYYRRRTPARKSDLHPPPQVHRPIFSLPARDILLEWLGEHRQDLFDEADQIVQGQVRLFSGDLVPLLLTPTGADRHWTETKIEPGEDIKLIWEPARFGWVFTLGRAFYLTGDERYAAAFWEHWETFTDANPVNCGPNWESGQEVALRLVAYLFALQVFGDSTHSRPERKTKLLLAVVDHARRIPPTLIYARAQDNNHLVSEACGLYLAGVCVPDHPQASSWRETGWRWLEQALRTQFDPDGTYIQHSMNYHRMVLQLALAALMGSKKEDRKFSPDVMEKLAAGTRWMIAQMDPQSGETPNLGNNDGAYILPLSIGTFRDHRPTAQAAAAAFCGGGVLPAGSWDEIAAWLGVEVTNFPDQAEVVSSPAVRRLGNGMEWATMRAVRYHARPAHADQLHVDLWFNGVNVLRDPGTYAYSHIAQWNNSLVHSRFHNTLTIDGQDPMLHIGRFLWLQWDQAAWIEDACRIPHLVTAEHYGYERMGIKHKRSLEWLQPGRWEVTDRVIPLRKQKGNCLTVHWLIMDGQWSLDGQKITVIRNQEKVTLEIWSEPVGKTAAIDQRLIRGGKTIHGEGIASENEGWYSPTYRNLEPALSYQVSFHISGSMVVRTRIELEQLN